ncbi:MAG: hypothetical protein IKW58_02185 [Alphaproteobacteria bacterium]|nr:hypothetical protein [Alphaproteobacteria bacterium]
MDLCVKLSEMSSNEFEAYFNSLTGVERLEFVSSRRQEINEVSEINILMKLCMCGFFDALLPITKYGNKDTVLKAFERVYAPWATCAALRLNKENEVKVLTFAANNLFVVDYMYNKLHFLKNVKSKSRWVENVIFQNASQDVLEFLFTSIAKDGIIISKNVGDILLERGTIETIKKYVRKVRYLGVRQSYATITALRKLKTRNDLCLDDKRELTYYLLNHLEFSPNTITKIRKLGLID